MHLLHNLMDGVKRVGPVHSSWMFAYERFNGWLHRRVMNHRHPEATLMETYRVGSYNAVCNSYSWMFAYERFNGWLHRRVMNHRHPEATLMETYRVGSYNAVCNSYCNYIMSARDVPTLNHKA